MAGIKRKISNEWEAGISLKKRKTDRPDHEAHLSIDDLAEILDLLKRHGYSSINYYDLGLFLGLLSPTLNVISKNHSGDVNAGLRECLETWLEQADNVKEKGGPSYYSLIQALRKLEENAVADGIDRQKHPACVIFTAQCESNECIVDVLPRIVMFLGMEKIISEMLVPTTGEVVLEAVKRSICFDYHNLEKFATVLKRLNAQSVTSVAHSLLKDYRKAFPDDYFRIVSKENINISLPLKLTPEFTKIRNMFTDLIDDVAQAMNNSVTYENLKRYVGRNKDLRPHLAHCKNTDEIIELIGDECSLINVGLLEGIVKKYEVKEAESSIQKYKNEIETFHKEGRPLRQFLDQYLAPASPLQCETATILVRKEVKDYELRDINVLMIVAFETLAPNVRVHVIKEGNSFTITCSFPVLLSESLIATALDNIDSLIERGVKKLTIGYSTVYDHDKLFQHEETTTSKKYIMSSEIKQQLYASVYSSQGTMEQLLISRTIQLLNSEEELASVQQLKEKNEKLEAEVKVLSGMRWEVDQSRTREMENIKDMELLQEKVSLLTSANDEKEKLEAEMSEMKWEISCFEKREIEHIKKIKILQEKISLELLIKETQQKQLQVQRSTEVSLYERALKEQGSADVAYARLMLLGSAGAGKTSLKRSLMEEPFNPHTTSTIVADVSSVRPFSHDWQTIRKNRWREATEEDELEEIARLFRSFHSRSPSHHVPIISAQHSHDESVSTSSIASGLNVESCIQLILERVNSTFQTKEPHIQPFLHIWDCGGQPVFLEILPAFLTPRTMFLLLFDASKDFRESWQSLQNTPDGEVLFGEIVNESTSDLMVKWMSTIHSHLMKPNKGDTSPSIYCIGTHGDKLNSKSKQEVKQQIKSLYEEKEFSNLIIDVLIVDNTTSGKGEDEDPSITELREATGDFINKLVVKTPVNWILFHKVLQELKQNVISVSDAIAIGAACHIRATDVPEVLKFYHELGAVLYYPYIDGLRNKVILSPKWFVNTIGKVFTLEGYKEGWSGTRWHLLRNKGILVQPLYQEVWQSSGIDPEEIIELLVHFRLVAQVQTELYDSRFKQFFLPAVLPGYTGDPNEVKPGYKLRASPVHITFSTGYVPPGFFTRLATTVTTNDNLELNFYKFTAPVIHSRSIYRNRVCFSYGHPSDDFVLTDINDAIQVDVLRYVPESSHPVPFRTVCQQILIFLNECCQKVEDILTLYHNDNIAYQSSRRIQYVCHCSPSSEVHYIQDIDAERQTHSDPVYCKMKRAPRPLTINESLWFREKRKDLSQENQPQEVSFLEKINYSPTQISEYNDDQQKVILTIRDLVDIVQVLKDGSFQAIKWFDLGLYLGLIHNDLKVIETNYPRDAERCLRECLAKWLTDDTEATWNKLTIALGEVGEASVAEYIRSRKEL